MCSVALMRIVVMMPHKAQRTRLHDGVTVTGGPVCIAFVRLFRVEICYDGPKSAFAANSGRNGTLARSAKWISAAPQQAARLWKVGHS